MAASRLHLIFVLTVMWGVGVIWLAPHPPMIDLPQHAGQVALYKQLVAGESPWGHLVELNIFNPYMIGYGLALPLSFVLPIAAALKLLLSAAYLAFVWMSVALRRRFKADARLDWLCVSSFFGFAYEWGFFTFLVAAPIGLCMILMAERYSARPGGARALGLIAIGAVLLLSHGLVFLFACGVGAALVAVRAPNWRQRVVTLWPFVVLGAAGAAFLVVLRLRAAGFPIVPTVPAVNWHFGLRYEVLAYSFSQVWSVGAALAGVVFLAAPWLMGLRIDWRRGAAWPFFSCVFLILAFVPHFIVENAYTYQRFALFLFPAYACLFSIPTSTSHKSANPWLGRLTVPLLVVTCWGLLATNSVRTWRFGQESAEFDAVMATLEPGQRAVSLAYDRKSEAAGGRNMYVHYASWYQAEKQGFVDFNFAWFWGVVARFHPETLSGVHPNIAWKPEQFDWQKQRGGDYRYFIVRHSGAMPADIFKAAPCQPALLVERGLWKVFERRTCAGASPMQ